MACFLKMSGVEAGATSPDLRNPISKTSYRHETQNPRETVHTQVPRKASMRPQRLPLRVPSLGTFLRDWRRTAETPSSGSRRLHKELAHY